MSTCVRLYSYSVSVHEAPDSGCNFAGEQDDQAGEELQDRIEKHQVSSHFQDSTCLMRQNKVLGNIKVSFEFSCKEQNLISHH